MEKLSNSDLVRLVALDMEMPMSVIKMVLENVASNITLEIKRGNAVKFSGLGTFRPVDRAARTCTNLQTGLPVNVPAKRVLGFKPEAGNKDI